jgi:hypothetical protein
MFPGDGGRQVRNSAGGIVQLSYGDDSLDPVAMEAEEGKPIDLARSLSMVHATTPRCPDSALNDGVAWLSALAHARAPESQSGNGALMPLYLCCLAVA